MVTAFSLLKELLCHFFFTPAHKKSVSRSASKIYRKSPFSIEQNKKEGINELV